MPLDQTQVRAGMLEILKTLAPEMDASRLVADAPLRKQIGVGDALDNTKSAEENEAAGERLGSALATQLMLKAVGACDIPMSDLM